MSDVIYKFPELREQIIEKGREEKTNKEFWERSKGNPSGDPNSHQNVILRRKRESRLAARRKRYHELHYEGKT